MCGQLNMSVYVLTKLTECDVNWPNCSAQLNYAQHSWAFKWQACLWLTTQMRRKLFMFRVEFWIFQQNNDIDTDSSQWICSSSQIQWIPPCEAKLLHCFSFRIVCSNFESAHCDCLKKMCKNTWQFSVDYSKFTFKLKRLQCHDSFRDGQQTSYINANIEEWTVGTFETKQKLIRIKGKMMEKLFELAISCKSTARWNQW